MLNLLMVKCCTNPTLAHSVLRFIVSLMLFLLCIICFPMVSCSFPSTILHHFDHYIHPILYFFLVQTSLVWGSYTTCKVGASTWSTMSTSDSFSPKEIALEVENFLPYFFNSILNFSLVCSGQIRMHSSREGVSMTISNLYSQQLGVCWHKKDDICCEDIYQKSLSHSIMAVLGSLDTMVIYDICRFQLSPGGKICRSSRSPSGILNSFMKADTLEILSPLGQYWLAWMHSAYANVSFISFYLNRMI